MARVTVAIAASSAGGRALASGEKLFRVFRLRFESFEAFLMEIFENRKLLLCSLSVECLRKSPVEARREIDATSHHCILRENARGLHVDWVVEEIERLERRVGIDAIYRAFLARGRVESYHARMQEGPLPERVESSPIEIVTQAR